MAFGRGRVEVDIIANDRSSRVYDHVANSMTGMATRINSSIVNINNGLHRYNSAMSRFHRNTQIALAGAGYLIYRFTRDAINEFAEFERQHGQTMGAIAANYDQTHQAQMRFIQAQQKLKEESLALGTVGPTGKGSLYYPQQVAFAQTSLGKAGIEPEEIPTVMPYILKFAGGNDKDLETAANYAVNLAKMFDIPSNEWGKMLDMATRSADISTIDVDDLFQSLKYAGGIGSALERPLEEILAMISVMGNVGLKGSVSGTGLQAFYTRILSPIGKTEMSMNTAPSDYSKQALAAFVDATVDEDGRFKDATIITQYLNDVMSTLDDREQAWFAHKLFGMFQMKSGFMLAKQGGDNLQNIIDDLVHNSPGTIDKKWDIMLDTSWGKRTAFHNALTGTKTDVGYRLSPFTDAVYEELFSVLTDMGNYRIDFTRLKGQLREASDLITQQYGNQMGELVSTLGTLGIDGTQIGLANLPIAQGVGVSITKLLAGDFPGSISAIADAIDRVNKNIDELPPELRTLASQARNAALALAAITSVNFAARLLESMTTIWRYTMGKMLADNKTANMAQKMVSQMAVTANIVYVNGMVAGGGMPGAGGKPVIVDQHGRPIASAPGTPGDKVPTKPMSQKFVGAANTAMWAYALMEMFGVNDWLLDKAGIEHGSTARNNINKGRTVANWGITAHAIDNYIFKNAGKQLIKNAATGIASGVKAGVATYGVGTASLMALPIAAGIGSIYQENKRIQDGQKLIESVIEANEEGRPWYWNGDNNGAIFGKIPAELEAEREANRYKYNNGQGFLLPAPPQKPSMSSGWGTGNMQAQIDYQKQMTEYNEMMREFRETTEQARKDFESMQARALRQYGVNLTWDEYNKHGDTSLFPYFMQNGPGSPTGLPSTIDILNNLMQMNSEKIDKVHNDLMTLEQPAPVVNVDVKPPNVKVDVKVDSQGNVTQHQYISDVGNVDEMYRIYNSRMGR